MSKTSNLEGLDLEIIESNTFIPDANHNSGLLDGLNL